MRFILGFKIKTNTHIATICALILVLVSVLFLHTKVSYAAAPNAVIINELMYNPSTGNQLDEYLELYNTTNATINLDGWCFTAGITLCFNGSHSIAAQDYLVISPNSAQLLATYGLYPAAIYTGALSNGGEAITLRDETAAVINTVNYTDTAPWPSSPDGSGPSLELKAVNLDNTQPVNWGASLVNGTPNVENSLVSAPAMPDISDVSDPNGITANQSVTITATIDGANSASLIYKRNFEADVTIPLFDDGAHGDGEAADQIYGANIPGQTIGSLMRYKISATNGSGTSTRPGSNDSINYLGYYVKDPSITSNAPILEWFISDTDYNELQTTGVDTEGKYPCVIVYGDDVYDNTTVRIKGNNTRGFPKHGFKYNLASGLTIQLAGAERSVKEFHFNADYRTANLAKVPTLWWAAKQSGLPTPDVITTRLQRNGQFEGLYNFIDKYEKQWRDDMGYSDGQLFEDYGEIVNGANDFTDLNSWRDNMLKDPYDPQIHDYLLDNTNLPNLISGMTFTAAISHLDQTITHNTLQYRDNETERWSILHWDFDLAMVVSGPKTRVSPYDMSGGEYDLRWYATAIYDQPDLRKLFYRRLRTIADRFYTNNELVDTYNAITDEHASDVALDNAKWPSHLRITEAEDRQSMSKQRSYLLAYLRQSWAIPSAQTLAEKQSVSIEEAVTDVTNANEYIKLFNSSSEAVDLSDWVIEGINYILPKSSVIPANGHLYLLRDDVGYKTTHASVLVAGQYDNDLGSSGTLTLKTDTGQVIDSYAY